MLNTCDEGVERRMYEKMECFLSWNIFELVTYNLFNQEKIALEFKKFGTEYRGSDGSEEWLLIMNEKINEDNSTFKHSIIAFSC